MAVNSHGDDFGARVNMWLRFDREIGPEHNAGIGGREVIVSWPKVQAEALVREVRQRAPRSVAFKCEQHDILAYVEKAKIVTNVVVNTTAGVCDFCGAKGKFEHLPARDVIVDQPDFVADDPDFEMPAFESRGAWAACDDCRPMIDGNQREALVEHCTETYMAEHQVPVIHREIIRDLVSTAHKAFWKARA